MDISDDLSEALSQHLLDQPYDPKSLHEEKFLIDHLVELTEDWEFGDVSLQELVGAFSGTGYDITLWISDKIEQGVYDEDALPSS